MNKHTLPALPYDYTALEPYIDARTMEIHHGKHHAAYVQKLNAAVEKHPEIAGLSVETLLTNLASLPEDIRAEVRNNVVSRMGVAGIFCGSVAQVSVAGNTLSDCADTAIAVNAATTATVRGNDIRGGGTGLWICHSEVVLDRNTVTDCGWWGIGLAAGTRGEVTGNTIEGAGEDGISCCGGAVASITANTVCRSSGTGIEVQHDGTHVVLARNSICDNGGLGIDLGDDGVAAPVFLVAGLAAVGARQHRVQPFGAGALLGDLQVAALALAGREAVDRRMAVLAFLLELGMRGVAAQLRPLARHRRDRARVEPAAGLQVEKRNPG